ncbi:Oidioi.mRNA.OKI2018_I69.PAR.g9287.t1.cds [Oikopleura dioica]|uniref:Oidioi.mRNA.OKI2018_I69.PAR.g9287.t1.cds n=1 Tax=Oikopleura dioica TaxID=34765 RepID=A0ABN7RMM6_OIKDI|nr:Oidioi.mRNA.OKI2018_I69.PAR.g9287.t1.cds [Oikopleura dioica]
MEEKNCFPSEMSPEENQSTEYTSNEQVSSLDPSESPKTVENDSRRDFVLEISPRGVLAFDLVFLELNEKLTTPFLGYNLTAKMIKRTDFLSALDYVFL